MATTKATEEYTVTGTYSPGEDRKTSTRRFALSVVAESFEDARTKAVYAIVQIGSGIRITRIEIDEPAF